MVVALQGRCFMYAKLLPQLLSFTMKSHITFLLLRFIVIFLPLNCTSVYCLIAQSGNPLDKPFIFGVDSLTQNSVVIPISLPRSTSMFDSIGNEIPLRTKPPYPKRRYMSVCYQIATDSLFTRDIAGTARVDSISRTLSCFDIRD
jgi:hypothetical protein